VDNSREVQKMKRLIVAGCGLLLIVGIVGWAALWHKSSVRVFNGHIMGESGNQFAKIEAKRNQIDLDKCDNIGRPEKRHFCDELVQVTDGFEQAHSDESYITFGRPSRRQSLTYGAADHIHAEFDEGGTLVKLIVEHVGEQDERMYHVRRGVFKALLKDLTAQFGTPSSVQDPTEKHSHPTAVWFISPHTEITFEGSDFGDGIVEYRYVEKSPEVANQAVQYAASTPLAPSSSPVPAAGTTASATLASQQIHSGPEDPRLALIIKALNRPDSPRTEHVPIPEQLWKDLGVTPTEEARKGDARALMLSGVQPTELLVEDLDPDFCGSGSGCPWSIYGLRGEVVKDGRASLKYQILLQSQGGVYVLDSAANGYRDLLIDGGAGGSVLKFNGTSYVVAECFSHGYKKVDVVQLTNCQ
jgi:hypothetical protein